MPNRRERRDALREQGLLPSKSDVLCSKSGGGTQEPLNMPPPPSLPPLTNAPDPDGDGRPRPKFLDYLNVRIGAPLALATFGIGLMIGNRFWIGAALFYLGLVWFAIDIAYERFFRLWDKMLRVLLCIVYIGAIGTMSKFWIFRDAPLTIRASSDAMHYGPGSEFHGIKWLSRYSSLDLVIGNPSSYDYDNFDASITTDLVINHMVQTGGLGHCTLEGINHADEPPHWQHEESGKPTGAADNPKWEYQVIPYDKNGLKLAPFLGADWTYRILCDKIPSNDEIRLLGALVVVSGSAEKCRAPCPVPFFANPKPAKWVKIATHFSTAGRQRMKNIPQCDIGKTCQVP